MTKMTMGINHPAGRSRTFSDHGRSFCTLVSHVNGSTRWKCGETCLDDFVVLDSDDDRNDTDDNKENVPC